MSGLETGVTPMMITAVLSGIATPAIAFIVALITWQNWETNKGALREKLFERRFEVFRETQKFLSMLTANDEHLDFEISRFSDTCQRSRFLFGQPIYEYLDDIRRRACDSQFQKSVMSNPTQHDDTQEQIRLYTVNKKWYFAQLSVIFHQFGPYLSFEKHK